MPIFGVDVSNNQRSVDWRALSTKADFAFVKATEGLDYIDPYWTPERVKAIRAAGIPFGPYHFARPQPGRDGADEADFAIRVALAAGWGQKGDLPLVLDIETATGAVGRREVVRFVRRFARRYRRRMKHRVIVYTGSFWRDFMGNPVTLTRSRLFLAAYVENPTPYLPAPWHFATIWQFTDSASVPGIAGNVDGDYFLRSRRAFRRMKIRKAKR